MRIHILLVIILMFHVSLVWADGQSRPECISGLCLGGDLVNLPNEERVRVLIGSKQQAIPSTPHRRSSCHLISTPEHTNVYVDLTFMQIKSTWNLVTFSVSTQKICDTPEPLTINFEFLIDNTIGIGSSREEVISEYGEPKYVLSPPPVEVINNYFHNIDQSPADTIIQYVANDDELLTTRFYLLNDKVIAFETSADM